MNERPGLNHRIETKMVITILYGLILFLAIRCLDPYNAPTARADVRNLVVDGFLNGTDGTCSIQLSRTVPLEVQSSPPWETDAEVLLEDETGTSYMLNEVRDGTYAASHLSFHSGSKIKLKITTFQHVEYESDVVTLLKTPPIDSVAWGAERAGVPIYITAHNGQEESLYYYWKFTETWSYTAGYQTSLTLDANYQVVPLTESIFQCWSTATSKDILVAAASTRDDDTGVISKFPLVIVPWESPKLQYRYSVLVEQRAISKETFEYLEELKKNTENLGTLFDPLPSAPAGNMKCLTRPNEMVQGNFTASTIEKKRIYINSSDLDRPAGAISVTGYGGCSLVEIRFPSDWLIFSPVGRGSNEPVQGTTHFCVDCRLNGGTNIQPEFWEW